MFEDKKLWKYLGCSAMLLTSLLLCGCQIGGTASKIKKSEGIETYEILTEEITALTEEWTDADGFTALDDVEDASEAVYDWAMDLEKSGAIEGASLNEDSHIVAFFLNDGRDYLYIPQCEDTYSGEDDFTITAVTMLAGYEDGVISAISGTSAEASADYILDHVVQCRSYESIVNVDASELKKDVGDFDETRVVFWRGHGGTYTNRQGIVEVAFALKERVTDKKEALYADDLDDGGDIPMTMSVAGSHYVILATFFEEYMPKMNGGLFFSGACCSACDGGRLAKIMIDKGMDAYVGSNGKIFTIYSDDIMRAVAEYLTEKDVDDRYLTIEDALAEAMEDVGETDYAGIRMILFQNNKTDSFRLVPAEDWVHSEIRVVDDENDELSNGTVTLTAKNGEEISMIFEQKNSLSGRFTGDVDPGEYTLKAQFAGYKPYEETITVPKGRSEWQYKIALEPNSYRAYVEVIEAYQEEYGEAKIVGNGSDAYEFISGVGFVQLLDFNKDGIEELMLVLGETQKSPGYQSMDTYYYPEYTVEVWTLVDDKAERIFNGGPMLASDISRSLVLTEYKDSWYLVNGMDGYETFIDFWEFKDGEFQIVHTEERNYNNPEPEYLIDGKVVSETVWKAMNKAWLKNKKSYSLLAQDVSDIAEITENTLETLGMK